jgi:hypothetical protein
VVILAQALTGPRGPAGARLQGSLLGEMRNPTVALVAFLPIG